VTRSPRRAPARLRRLVVGVVGIAIVGGTLTTLAIATDTFGAGERWITVIAKIQRLVEGPVPDRPTLGTVLVTEPPDDSESASPVPSATPKPTKHTPGVTPAPTATPTPKPQPTPVDFDIVDDPNAVFASQHHKDWCAPAGIQTVLAIMGKADTSVQTQIDLNDRIHRWEAYKDSHNGDWGPAAMALALDDEGVPGYEVHAFQTLTYALRDAAVAIRETRSPAILLAWRGAHTWVMSGYRADSDPRFFRNSKIEGAYILDPWYPRISSIWGPSNPPGTFTTFAELQDNFLPWKRPEGIYPDRDGLWITVVPTQPRAGAA
jgi:hypothetical protein